MNILQLFKCCARGCSRGVHGALAMCATVVLFATGAPAVAGTLTITPTFDSSITSLPGAAVIEAAINAAILAVENNVSSPNNITVKIDFQNMNTGLGQSESGIYTVPYYNYYNALKAVATSPNQLAALASLGPAPTGPSSGNPVNGTTPIDVTAPEGRNLGFNTPGVVTGPGGTYDTIISLNTSITSPPNGISGNYGLQAVANHEIDEALGIGGTGSTLGEFTTDVGDLDLYRYSAPGVRSWSTSAASSYFSIDGGVTVLSYFNQVPGADFADWQSDPIPGGFGPQVQDAFGEPGTNPALGVNELTAFESIGYSLNSENSAAPEPATVTLLGMGVASLCGYGWRRRNVAAA